MSTPDAGCNCNWAPCFRRDIKYIKHPQILSSSSFSLPLSKTQGGVGLLFAIIDLYCLRETLEVIKKRPGTPLPNSQEAAMNYETNRGLPKKSTSETSGCRCSDCARCRCCRQSNSQVGRSSKRSPYMEPRWCRWCLSNDMFIYIYIYSPGICRIYIYTYIYVCVCEHRLGQRIYEQHVL